ncbi:protein FAR1-RELATED SEQUENCE 5-like [Coffea arabica]|uniref:Protein FAR1-RELATED SEQUENCE 5-like n=1 Tax=Coffea arabica TaxID=13443 RepID=A0ABM4W8N7_COFAR
MAISCDLTYRKQIERDVINKVLGKERDDDRTTVPAPVESYLRIVVEPKLPSTFLQEINDNALPLCITDSNQGNQIFLHLAIPDDLVPKLGMEFDTEVAARNFYQKYAKASGFGTRLSKGRKDKNSDMMLDRVFCCSREGKRPRDKCNMILKCPRPETRCDCGARMKISCRQAEKYYVVQFVTEHNHELSTLSKTHLFKSHRHMIIAHEAETDMARSCRIAPKQSIELMSKQVDGRENLGFIRDDLKKLLTIQKIHTNDAR